MKHLGQSLENYLVCDRCGHSIKLLLRDPLWGDEIDWNTDWEQYLCDECEEAIWQDLFDECCPRCETHPCERGGDCWINPWPRLMYLCYVAPKTAYPRGTDRWFKRIDTDGLLFSEGTTRDSLKIDQAGGIGDVTANI